LSGPPGVGKSKLLNAVGEKLGMFYWNIDCNNIIANTLNQTQANIKTVFSKFQESSPCILQMRNIQVLKNNF
jgi:SpoVK/Ycf46/Vps4 family AAA+-type ATPase